MTLKGILLLFCGLGEFFAILSVAEMLWRRIRYKGKKENIRFGVKGTVFYAVLIFAIPFCHILNTGEMIPEGIYRKDISLISVEDGEEVSFALQADISISYDTYSTGFRGDTEEFETVQSITLNKIYSNDGTQLIAEVYKDNIEPNYDENLEINGKEVTVNIGSINRGTLDISFADIWNGYSLVEKMEPVIGIICAIICTCCGTIQLCAALEKIKKR